MKRIARFGRIGLLRLYWQATSRDVAFGWVEFQRERAGDESILPDILIERLQEFDQVF